MHGPDRVSSQFILLTVFLALTFLMGGGARADIQSLAILRPVTILFCGIGLWTLRGDQIRRYPVLFGLAAAVFGLTLLHLVPLPPSLWTRLPGREIIGQIDRAADIAGTWRPISLVPWATRNALFSLFAPLATLILAVQLGRSDRSRLLVVLTAFGIASGLLGLLQVVGAADSPLYLYRITNEGTAVGLFANRNHAAVYLACLFPMLAVFSSLSARSLEQRRFRTWICVAIAVVLVPLILVTGSRAGVVAALIGLASIALLYRQPKLEVPAKRRGGPQSGKWAIIGFSGAAALALFAAMFSRATAIERLMASDQTDDLRFKVWGPIADMAWKYLPVGSGVGSFVATFQLDEPVKLLKPSYLNHAHNDWLETYLTAGLPGLLILAVVLVAFVRRSITVWRRPDRAQPEVAFARLGSILLLILAFASASDYPLRTPSLMCVAVIAGIWLQASADRAMRPSLSKMDGSLAKSPLAHGSFPESNI